MIRGGELTGTSNKPLRHTRKHHSTRGAEETNKKRQTIRTPHATSLTLHHINPSTAGEPWETSPAVTSPALIRPITTSSSSAARADTLSSSVEKASDVQSYDQRGSDSWKLSTESHHDKKNMPSPLRAAYFYVFFQRLCSRNPVTAMRSWALTYVSVSVGSFKRTAVRRSRLWSMK